jgi:hypothetical protein
VADLKFASMKSVLCVVSLLIGLLGGYWFFGAGESVGRPTLASAASAPRLAAEQCDEDSVDPVAGSGGVSLVHQHGITAEWLASLQGQTQFEQIGALHARLQTASAADFPAILAALKDSTLAMNGLVRSMLTTKWAEQDPLGMLAYVESRPDRERWRLQKGLFGTWAQSDVSAAYAAAQGVADVRFRNLAIQAVMRSVAAEDASHALELAELLEDPRSRNVSLQAVVQAVAAENPQRAIEIAQAQMDRGVMRYAPHLFATIFSQWASRDATAARQAAVALPDSPIKVKALSGALQQWVATDPMAALGWLDALAVDSSVYHSRKAVFRQVLNQDFAIAKAFIDAEADPVARREILSQLYVNNFAWNRSDAEIESMLEWVGAVATGSLHDQKVSEVLGAMAESDSGRAVDFMLQMPPGNARMNALGTIARIMAGRDPVAALAFAQSLEYEDERRRALTNIGNLLPRHGVATGSALIAGSEDPLVQQQLAGRMVSEWVKYDRAAALAFVEDLSDAQARHTAVGSILNHWIQSEPAEAMDYMVTALPQDRLGPNLSAAFSQWASQDPAQAVAWLDRLPAGIGAQQANIYNRVAQAYVQHDPMAASEWIAGLDAGPARDATVKTLVSHISKTDAEAGFIWAATVSDANDRRNSLNQVVREWGRTDPAAATAAVSEATVDASEKERLFEVVEQSQAQEYDRE